MVDRRRGPARHGAPATTSGGDDPAVAPHRRRRWLPVTASVAGGILLGGTLVVAMSHPGATRGSREAVERLAPPAPAEAERTAGAGPLPDGRPPSSEVAEATAGSAEPAPSLGAGTGAIEELDQLLADYDEALGALSATPAAAAEAGHPLLVRWHALVAAGSELDQAMRTRIHDDVVERSMVVRPGPDGVTFTTRVLQARVDGDGGIDFEHCGYSPGVGVHVLTGEVLDDQRATSRGTGRAERDVRGALVLVALHDDEVRLLVPGEPDPCTSSAVADRPGGGS